MDKTKIMIDAIQSFFGDTSQSTQETVDGLNRAKDLINMLLETLEDDDSAD